MQTPLAVVGAVSEAVLPVEDRCQGMAVSGEMNLAYIVQALADLVLSQPDQVPSGMIDVCLSNLASLTLTLTLGVTHQQLNLLTSHTSVSAR